MKNCFPYALIWLFLSLSSPIFATFTKSEYIQTFQDFAISEMDRTGIPASIKMAQGILESRYGNSSLATEANNHFGIKCHSSWSGKTYYIKDDDFDSRGRLIESCFRSYPTALHSYMDHSDFLTGGSRYAFLFDYHKTDYKKWAKGLKAAGYATNPEYAELLIRVVEENNLASLDHKTNDILAFKPTVKKPGHSSQHEQEEVASVIPEYGETLPVFPKTSKETIFRINDVKAVVAKPGESSLSLAQRMHINLNRLLRYNELNESEGLIPNQYVYLQPKRKAWRGKSNSHIVKEGETMYSISQLYGLQKESLYERNLMNIASNSQPAVGQSIKLKGKAGRMPVLREEGYRPPPKFMQDAGNGIPVEEEITEIVPPRPRPAPLKPVVAAKPEATVTVPKPEEKSEEFSAGQPVFKEPAKSEIFNEERTFSRNEISLTKDKKPIQIEEPAGPSLVYVETKPAESSNENSVSEKPVPVFFPSNPGPAEKAREEMQNPEVPADQAPVSNKPSRRMHEVKSGETLYSISRMYNISVDQLRQMNGLNSNMIKTGQELRVK